ncbi:MAG: Peptidase [Candidatus Saccharibacteria bacterium]|nr:Peptidase [Candidatus Saccharibacteria bacterium]
MKLGNKNSEEGSQRHAVLRSVGNIVVVVAVFAFGVGIGQGKITLGLSHSLSSENQQLPGKLNYTSVDEVYKSLKENYDGKITETQLTDGLKHGLATATKDPYTVFFTAKEATDFNKELNNSFSGIGAQLGQDSDGNIEVIAPIDGLPAAKAGIMAKDIIASINGTSTAGMSVDEAVTKIRGPKDTKVTLQLVRNKQQALTLTITRQDIVLPSVKTKTLDGNIGYIQITTFANDTVDLTQKAAQQFKDAGVKGIVLDLRNDPGGLLDAAVRVSSLWLPAGKNVLKEQRGSTVVQSYEALGGDILNGIPTVILVNDGSASASEITAGALHDNKAAYIIGEKSYGKGVVQQLISFNDGSQLKVTVASWYRPNGQNINHKGITPDKTVKISADDAKAGTDTQLQAAQAYLAK